MPDPSDEPFEIVVVGSANLDIVVPVPHHPRPGETVLGGDHRQVPGGKGANQATAAARLGRRVAFVGCVGDDPAGEVLLASLRSAGVNIDAVTIIDEAPSGIATISVSAEGENAIVVSPG
ncbi:MAG: ribokinase, partial [Acidimicrobiales bacterium]|nr:ribokinase [Acidimicrobiales bacterium]